MAQNKGNDSASIIFFVIAIIVVIGFFAIALAGNTPASTSGGDSSTVSITADGVQIVEVTVKPGGYSPRVIAAKGGIPTIVRMKSVNAFGCERAFRFPRLGIDRNLPTSGNTDIDIQTPASGTSLNGTCTMGMYNFTINFT